MDSQQNSQGTSQTARQAAALRELRDSGVLSEAEYQQKLKALQGSGAAPHAQPASGKAGPGHTWHMKRAVFRQNTSYDALPQWGIPARQGKDVDALSMLIPVDWEFQAGTAPPPLDCNMNPGRVAVFTNAPDKTMGLAIIPGKASMWSNDQQLLRSVQADNQQWKSSFCVLEQPQPLAAKLPGILQNVSKDIQVTGSIQPVPGLSDKLGAMLEQANRNLAQQGAHVEATAGRLPIRGSDGGVTSEGFFSALQVVRTDRLPSGATVTSVDYPIQVITLAPPGRYAEFESMFNAMLDSVTIDPDFAQSSAQIAANLVSIRQQTKQRLNQIAANMAADNANAARQQASIRAGVQAYSNQVHASVAANRSAALDHSAQQFALYMGDKAIYKDPTTGSRVEMPSQYNHAWASTVGNTTEYILTDSPSYNPGANWKQLQEER